VLASLFTTTAFSTSGPFSEQEDEERCAKTKQNTDKQQQLFAFQIATKNNAIQRKEQLL